MEYLELEQSNPILFDFDDDEVKLYRKAAAAIDNNNNNMKCSRQ